MDLTIKLSRISNEDVSRLRKLARISRIPIDTIVENQLMAWLVAMEKKFPDVGSCPACSLNGIDSQLKGRPIFEAEKEGLVKINEKTDRDLIKDTMYVICPKCLWWGLKDESTLS